MKKSNEFIRRVIRLFLIIPLFNWIYRVEVKGKENLIQDGKAIISGNHVHSFDPIFLLGISKKNISFFSKIELFSNPFNRWIAKTFKMIPVNRDEADIKSIRLAMKILNEDGLVGLFPEGTRNGIFKGQDFKDGAMFIALKTNTPIIPVGISGKLKPFRKTYINIGKPIYFNDRIPEGMTARDKEVVEELTLQLRDEVLNLLIPEDKQKYIAAIKVLDENKETDNKEINKEDNKNEN